MRLAVLPALLAGVVGAMAPASPAEAECVEVTVEVHTQGKPHWYPLGAEKMCVTETPWNQGQGTGVGDDADTQLAPCTPTGVWVEVWTTGP